jgi:fibronectin type 3 domain-containing protein
MRYNIYRSEDTGRSYPYVVRGVTETTYVDKSVESGKSYRYVVTSIDASAHESVQTEVVNITIP